LGLNIMKILITGAGGKLGRELIKFFPGALTPSIEEMDITDSKSVSDFVLKNKPDLTIHLAAMTNVRKCEEDKEMAFKTNAFGTKNLLKACLSSNIACRFVYISTACVFQGDRGNYSEEDMPQPKNYYSLTKYLGEIMVQCYGEGADWLIIRTNFVFREKWPYPKAFSDRWGTYLFADDLASAIKNVVDQNLTGVVHVCGKEKLSMYDLAKITTPDIQPMTFSDYSGPPLTRDMSLVSKRIPPFELTR